MNQLTTKQLAAARDWLCDCTWSDTDAEEFIVMSANEIERAIARFFLGGIPAFIETCDPTEPTRPDQSKDAGTTTEAHESDHTEAAPATRKRPAGAHSLSADTRGSAMEPTPQTNLFGHYQPTAIKGKQMPLFHEPVDVPIPDARPAIDKRIARKFDESATPLLFAEQPAEPGQR